MIIVFYVLNNKKRKRKRGRIVVKILSEKNYGNFRKSMRYKIENFKNNSKKQTIKLN
jgi:hypothetical protein